MEAIAYCTASSYDTVALYRVIRENYQVQLNRRVLTIHLNEEENQYIFYFPYGSTIFWNIPANEEKRYLDLVKPYEKTPLLRYENDTFYFEIGEKPGVRGDEFIIPDTDPLTIHAISHGLAQSVKLGVFESTVQKTYNTTKHIPESIAEEGRIPLSLKQIRKMMGRLFIERSSINLYSDILDTPEFFWEHNDLQPLYQVIANDLDITTRVEVLNQRLDVLHELFNMLGTELNNQHSTRLEWIIVLLILIEVIMTLSKDIFGWI